MYIVDGIAYAGEQLPVRVRDVKPLKEHRLLLAFTNGEERIFDCSPLLAYPAFKPLEDASTFNAVRAAYGTVCWPGDIDYCPDALYAQSQPAD